VHGPSTPDVMTELTFDRGRAREIAFRIAERGPGRNRVTEWLGRLDLRDPANRAAAESLLTHGLPWPSEVLSDLRALARRTAAVGTVERAEYAVRDDSANLELGARLGVAIGVEAGDVRVDRRLVSASAWTNGSHERVREDCLL
jgi:hypothetical protein